MIFFTTTIPSLPVYFPQKAKTNATRHKSLTKRHKISGPKEKTTMIQQQNKTTFWQINPSVSTPLLVWLSCSTAGSILFTTTYLIEGATRSGYNALQQAISALSLSSSGWVQQINFVVFGLIILCTAPAWRKLLKGGPGATWYPIFRVLEGFGILMDGFFSQDPAPGYPVGVTLGSPTLHGILHILFAFLAITSIAVGFFVLARRFFGDPQWRGWFIYTLLTGLFTIVFITLFGMANSHHSDIAGLFERLSTSLGTVWGLLLLARLWTGTAFPSPKKAHSQG
jgi:Protein of unknown function (DUF998)